MTRRKPAGMTYETWIERLIRESEERGEFDDLPGAGKPIADLDKPYDEMWWVRQLVQRERLSLLPPALELKKDVEDQLKRIAKLTSEREVRDLVLALNDRIRKLNRLAVEGPPSTLSPLDVDEVLEAWRQSKNLP
jgi:hypothetical protein